MKKKILFLVIVVLLYLILGTTVPFINHKEVPDDYQQNFSTAELLKGAPGNDRIRYIKDNEEALLIRLQMIQAAETEVIMSTFDFNADKAGKDLLAAMLEAADRGVQVKIIVDGISGFLDMRGSEWFQALAAHQNIEMKVYNPINLIKPWALQTRLHDKYLIIDESMYLLGGRNNMELFLGSYSEEQNIDGDLFVLGTAETSTSLTELKAYFAEVWTLPESKEYRCRRVTEKISRAGSELTAHREELRGRYPQAYAPVDWQAQTMAAESIGLLANPTGAVNKAPTLWYGLQEIMKTGDEVTIHTPYIICSKEMYADLTSLSETVGSVSIITNDPTGGANPWGCTDYLNQKNKILATGVTMYEYLGSHSRHAKTILVDDDISIVGSFNFDMRSAYLDTELMLVVKSKELNALLAADTQQDLEYCRSISAGRDYVDGEKYEARELSFGKKVMYAVLRVVIQPIRYLL